MRRAIAVLLALVLAMPDTLGNITVPDPGTSGTLGLQIDWTYQREHAPTIAIHQFGSANHKITQRFWLGDGARRFLVKATMNDTERQALRDFWEARKGPYQGFTFNYPNESGSGTTAFTVRFENEPLSWEFLADVIATTGVTLVEIPDPAAAPTYTLNSTLTRFPSAGLQTALLDQVQRVIPLIKITVKTAGYPEIYVSNRRCTVGAQLYQARLLNWDGISQGMNGESDQASFVLGNADRVIRDLANDTDLWAARLEFSLFHVGTGIKVDLWSGEVKDWAGSEGPEFQLTCSDTLDLRLEYPPRKVSRSCWKTFNDGAACPYATEGSAGGHTSCDKSEDACTARGMLHRFGGIIAKPQGVRVKDNSTGTWGINRELFTATSMVNDSIYGLALPEIYTDAEMPVNCLIAAGREESDFYAALGIVGAGPISGYASDGNKHKLDGQIPHGPLPLGLRRSFGTDPATNNDPDSGSDQFSLSAVGGGFTGEKSAGVAFIEIRRSDPKGIQVSRIQDHQMQAVVSGGMGGWYWDVPGTRLWSATNTNPVWIAVNALLRAKALDLASAAAQTAVFDVDAAIAAAAICSTVVPQFFGVGTETQFRFRGVIADPKPLRDWLQEILNNCLGYFTSAFGKLKIGLRTNSSVVEAFTAGNIVLDSLQLASIAPAFNDLTGEFADAEYEYARNTVPLDDETHRNKYGRVKGTINYLGTFTKSQCARLVTTRLREEIGGITAAEWKNARRGSFKTTVLALNVEPGMICSLTHEDMPGGAGEFRVRGWRLNSDFSIDVDWQTTTDSMYDMAVGPKPADVAADAVPAEIVNNLIPGNVTLGTPQVFFTEPDLQGKTYARITIPITPPSPIGAFNQMRVFLQAPDDIVPTKADARGLDTAGNIGGFTIQANLSPTADQATDTFTLTAHGLLDGYQIIFRNEGGALPAGITAGVTHYVVQKTANTFKVSLTSGGAAVDFTSNGTGTHFIFFADVSRLVPSVEPIPFGPFPYDADERMITITHEAPYDAEYWRVYVCSGSSVVQQPLVKADQASPSPNALILITPPAVYVSGAEYAPLAASFSLVNGFPQYKVDEAGDQTWNYAVEWTNNTNDPRAGLLGGYDIVIEYPDGRRELNSSPSRTDSRHDSDYWPVDSVGVTFKVWLVSWRVDGRKNSIVPGVTPMVSFTVVRQAFGGAGQEYAPVVTGLAVAQSYGINGTGQRVLLIDSSWTKPSSAQFGGVIVVMIRGGVHYELTGIEPGVSVRSELNHFPTANEAVTVYALSVDTNNRKNTYQAGTTPAVAFDLLPPALGSTGIEYTALVTSPSASLTYGVSGDGVEVYGFLLNATAPADVTWTAWIAYARRQSDGAVYALTGPEQSAVYTDYWPIRGSETFDIYFRSVDVNGNENTLSLTVTPKVTGLTPTLQTTGKIKLFRADPTTFNTAEFEIIGAATFQTKIIVAEKIQVGSILRVGGGTGGSAPSFAGQANGQIAVYNGSNVLRAWMGQNGSIFGGWFGELYVGGSGPTTAPIYANASGVVIIGGINVGTPYISVQNASAAEVGRIGANIDTGFHGAWFKSVRISSSLGASSKIECDGTTLSLTIVSGTTTIAINPTDHIKVTDTGATRFATLSQAQIRVEKTTDNLQFAQLVLDACQVQGAGGTNRSTLTPTLLEIANNQVLSGRKTGWSTWTGTATRTSKATYSGTASASYTQSELQGVMDKLKEITEGFKAMLDDFHSTAGHGALGT